MALSTATWTCDRDGAQGTSQTEDPPDGLVAHPRLLHRLSAGQSRALSGLRGSSCRVYRRELRRPLGERLMAALDFPSDPVDAELYDAPNGVRYKWSEADGLWMVAPADTVEEPPPERDRRWRRCRRGAGDRRRFQLDTERSMST